jgi:hypothetical protein
MNIKRLLEKFTLYDRILIISILFIIVVSVSYGVVIVINRKKMQDGVALIRQNNTVILQMTQEQMKKTGYMILNLLGEAVLLKLKREKCDCFQCLKVFAKSNLFKYRLD